MLTFLGLVKDFAPVLSEGGEEVNDWEWRQDGSGKQRVAESLLGGGQYREWQDIGKGLGMIRKGIPVRTLKLDFEMVVVAPREQ